MSGRLRRPIILARGARKLRTFSCFITDDRYSIPTLAFLVTADEGLARELALRRLLESPHHRQIELLEDGQRIFLRRRTPIDDGPPAAE
jgi:hypothetical protein